MDILQPNAAWLTGSVIVAITLAWALLPPRRRKRSRQQLEDLPMELTLRVHLDGRLEHTGAVASDRLPVRDSTDDQPVTLDAKESVRQVKRYFIDVPFLVDSFRYVCPDEFEVHGERFKEVFHYCTGMQVDEQTYVINRIVPVDFARQSRGGVLVADRSNISALMHLDELGLPLVAHAHSHPGYGREATCPSSTDHGFQDRLLRGGHIAIGLIFSRDGYVRFFSTSGESFEINIIGNHIEQVGHHVYRLSLDD